ncbi:MAG: hypothetical protein ACTHQ3_15825 [Motilibacteraceae bacterium]
MLPRAVSEHYRAQQRQVVSTLALTRREWAKMGPDFDASWRTVGPRLLLLTTSAQVGAAGNGARYVPATLDQLGTHVEPLADVDPNGFGGWASDGRPLDTLLYGAVTTAKQHVLEGATPAQALRLGGKWLDMAVHTQIADAGRQAASVGIAARPKVGWVRMVNPPCCPRCAVLAGRFYRWSSGFRRHPRCDCVHIPTTLANPAATLGSDPQALFDSGQVHGLNESERKAIAEGADPGQVVNARRGRQGMTTTEGTTKHGLAGVRLQGRQRLTPDGIYRIASDRGEALRLLKQHGYLL